MEKWDNKYEGKNPFTVPEGYFEDLEDKVVERLKEEVRPKKVKWVSLLLPYAGLVAVFMLAFFIVQLVLPHFVDENRMIKGRVDSIEPEILSNAVVLDETFTPSSEDIYEYLSVELKDYDLVYAELYNEMK
ncbi:hypothetical protein LJB85_03050 [Porphyromonadaceae bacterium OttesenSCG-928-L07]|nr:hypothetical protein [Porphyromonadaceae bacterium OttesenSCG-928-L07]MDL2252147.1 hypothetical protein [Odoribacter sp. OttesenSCG-928-J03]